MTTTTYRVADVTYTREAFISAAHGILVVRIRADRPGSISVGVELSSPQHGTAASMAIAFILPGIMVVNTALAAPCASPSKRAYSLRAAALRPSNPVVVENADSVVILLDIATSFVRFDDVSGNPRSAHRRPHASGRRPGIRRTAGRSSGEHRRLFRRLDIDLGRTEAADLPTDTRIKLFAEGDDPALAALYVQYGRYLMITSSRPGTQPRPCRGYGTGEPVRPGVANTPPISTCR